jgi:hypothetical protein
MLNFCFFHLTHNESLTNFKVSMEVMGQNASIKYQLYWYLLLSGLRASLRRIFQFVVRYENSSCLSFAAQAETA